MAPRTNLPAYATKYFSDVKRYGPLPPDWQVVKGDHDNPRYMSKSGVDNGSVHPLSPEGRAKGLQYHPSSDSRIKFPGIPQPPIAYNPTNLVWVPYSSPTDALGKALAAQLNGITPDMIANAFAKAKEDKSVVKELYHPADRGLIIAEVEPYLSAIARVLDRNLIVVCPRVETVEQWNYVWNPRPPIAIHARWSTGYQGDRKPVILGFLPSINEQSAKKGLWYVMKPTEQLKKGWEALWQRPNWSSWYKSFWHRDLTFEDFAWVMVRAHRIRSLGGPVPDNEIGEWVAQYGRRLYSNLAKDQGSARLKREKRVQENFEFDKEKKTYRGPGLTYHMLGAQIAMYKPGTTVRIFAEQWDKAILAWYKYKAVRNTTGGVREWKEVIRLFEDIDSISIYGKLRGAYNP